MSAHKVVPLRPREVVTDDMLDRALRAFNVSLVRNRTGARAALRSAIEAALDDPSRTPAPARSPAPRRRSGRQISFLRGVRTLAGWLEDIHGYTPEGAERAARIVLTRALPTRQRYPRPQRASDNERRAA